MTVSDVHFLTTTMLPRLRSLRRLLLVVRPRPLLLVLVLAVAAMMPVSAASASSHDDATTTTISLSPDFSVFTLVSKTVVSMQAVINPLMRRGFSPIHDPMFAALAKANTQLNRLQGYSAYPKLVVAELDAPSGTALCHNVGIDYNLTLSCASSHPGEPDGTISSIDYASFGQLNGNCLSFTEGKCSSPNATAIIEKMCLGQRECTVPADPLLFGQPCPSAPNTVRLAAQVQCDPPRNHTYWDFSLMNPLVEDIMAATGDRSHIIDLCTWPAWLFNLSNETSTHYYPDDPNEVDWDYLQGHVPLDPTANAVGEYFARVASYYTQGGMTDEYGVFHASPYNYNWQIWEVLNELDHRMDIAVYTRIYDAVQRHVRACCDPDGLMEFMGLALAGARDLGYNMTLFEYFLNHSNHEAGATLDWVSFHFYGHPTDRTNISAWQQIFDSSDIFIPHMVEVLAVREELSPETKTALDELGTILPDDQVVGAAIPPPLFWNAASAGFAYVYARSLPLGLDAVVSSQLIGNPYMPELDLLPQFPSIAMVNWTTGAPNARYWLVRMMLDHLAPGDPVVQMSVSVNGASAMPADQVLRPVYAVAFAAQPAVSDGESATQSRALPSSLASNRLLLVNTQYENVIVVLPGGLITADTQAWVVDEVSGESPPRALAFVNGTTLQLLPFAVCIVVLSHDDVPSRVMDESR